MKNCSSCDRVTRSIAPGMTPSNAIVKIKRTGASIVILDVNTVFVRSFIHLFVLYYKLNRLAFLALLAGANVPTVKREY